MISDIHGVSGRAMLEAIVAGERNPKVLAQLARGTMRGKIRQLEEALDCSFLTERARRRPGDDAGHHRLTTPPRSRS